MGKKLRKPKVKEWNNNLPDVQQWIPRKVGNVVGESFATRCRQIRNRIISDATHERETNIDNFDSGSGVEDIVRRELISLCPRRYLVTAGTIDDRNGCTAGDYEVVIADNFWSPILKAGATQTSRKVHLPIEAVYGVIEVKQSIDFDILDEAMKKVVVCQKLYRPVTPASRILENVDLQFEIDSDKYKAVILPNKTTPIFTAILAINIKPGISMTDLIMRFVAINQKLKRKEVVQVLCVLDAGCAFWAWIDDTGPVMALFRDNESQRTLYPLFNLNNEGYEPFYPFATLLLKHLYVTTLPLHDLPEAYGPREHSAESLFPYDYDLSIPPDLGKPVMTNGEHYLLQDMDESKKRNRTQNG